MITTKVSVAQRSFVVSSRTSALGRMRESATLSSSHRLLPTNQPIGLAEVLAFIAIQGMRHKGARGGIQ